MFLFVARFEDIKCTVLLVTCFAVLVRRVCMLPGSFIVGLSFTTLRLLNCCMLLWFESWQLPALEHGDEVCCVCCMFHGVYVTGAGVSRHVSFVS